MRGKTQRHSVSVTIDLPRWIEEIADWSKSYTTDEEKMTLAIELARQNVAHGSGGPFGAAIFDAETGKLLGVGVNSVVPAHNSILHAEVVAIMMAENAQGSYTLSEGSARRELFTSCEPCAMCLGATLWSGVKRLVCAATGEDARAIGFDEGPVFPESYRYLEAASIEVVRGLLRREASQVLRDYACSGGTIYNGRLSR